MTLHDTMIYVSKNRECVAMMEPGQHELPDYAEAAAALRRGGLVQSPAEVHGFALGLYVAAVPEPRAVWQQELYSTLDPADVLAGECRLVLDKVFDSVFAMAPDEPLQLRLLLPEGIEVSRAHLAAVRDWCQGFLFGFGLGGEALRARLSEEAQGLLRDLAQFTRLDTEDVENDAENQSALIEIEEYLRVGVMLLCDDVGSDRGQHERE